MAGAHYNVNIHGKILGSLENWLAQFYDWIYYFVINKTYPNQNSVVIGRYSAAN